MSGQCVAGHQGAGTAPQMNHFNSRSVLSPSSGGWTSGIETVAGVVPSEGSGEAPLFWVLPRFRGCGGHLLCPLAFGLQLHVHMMFSLDMCLCPNSPLFML